MAIAELNAIEGRRTTHRRQGLQVVGLAGEGSDVGDRELDVGGTRVVGPERHQTQRPERVDQDCADSGDRLGAGEPNEHGTGCCGRRLGQIIANRGVQLRLAGARQVEACRCRLGSIGQVTAWVRPVGLARSRRWEGDSEVEETGKAAHRDVRLLRTKLDPVEVGLAVGGEQCDLLATGRQLDEACSGPCCPSSSAQISSELPGATV